MEKRFKLTDLQFTQVVEAQREVWAAQMQHEAAVRRANSVRVLVMDAHGLADVADTSVDEKTRELVIVLPDKPEPAQPLGK